MSDVSGARRPGPVLTLAIDVALVLVFCVIGRMSHAEGILGDIPGLANTIWPFLAAVLVVSLAAMVVRVPTERMRPGVVVWIVTVGGGLALRAAAGQGTALPFMIVTALTLALLLIGWRAVLALIRRLRTDRTA